jgi:hypothetical protein
MNSKKSITYISDENDLTTLMNVFGVYAQNQQKPVHYYYSSSSIF